METIWWKTQSIDPKTKQRIGIPTLHVVLKNDDEKIKGIVLSSDIVSNIEDAKNSIVDKLISRLEDTYKEVEQQLNK
jgi:hypothetical protein